MPKRTVTTIVGASFNVTTGASVKIGDEEVPARILHIMDGPDMINVLLADAQAPELADMIRADGIVVPKVVPIPGTKGVKG